MNTSDAGVATVFGDALASGDASKFGGGATGSLGDGATGSLGDGATVETSSPAGDAPRVGGDAGVAPVLDGPAGVSDALARMDMSADQVQVPPAGSCKGTCDGVCAGSCSVACNLTMADGMCASRCAGYCAGTCTGACTPTGKPCAVPGTMILHGQNCPMKRSVPYICDEGVCKPMMPPGACALGPGQTWEGLTFVPPGERCPGTTPGGICRNGLCCHGCWNGSRCIPKEEQTDDVCGTAGAMCASTPITNWSYTGPCNGGPFATRPNCRDPSTSTVLCCGKVGPNGCTM